MTARPIARPPCAARGCPVPASYTPPVYQAYELTPDKRWIVTRPLALCPRHHSMYRFGTPPGPLPDIVPGVEGDVGCIDLRDLDTRTHAAWKEAMQQSHAPR